MRSQLIKKKPKKFDVASLLFMVIIAFSALTAAILVASRAADIPNIESQALSFFKAPPDISYYTRKNIQTKRGGFNIDLAVIDLGQGKIDLLTETAAGGDCRNNCPARPLKDFVSVNHGFAGMHGAYFCPPDYVSCQGKTNYYFYPFYNTRRKFLVNSGEIKWLQGSILVFDENYNHYYFVDGREFKSIAAFENKYKVKVRALLSNSPTLIFQGKNIVASQKMDSKQKNTKGLRGAIGVKGKVIYLVISRAATVPDMASVMEALGVTTALNLDGGGSSALYWNGAYKVGPGRLLPTAIIFKAK